MNRQVTLEDIRKVLCENVDYSFCDKAKNLEQISDDELLDINIVEDMGLDSLDLMVLTMSLERNCDVVIPDVTFDAIKERGSTVRVLLEETNRNLITRLNP